MKKTALTILAGILTIGVSAQNMYEGLMFSRNNYEGTARSVAMGNAVTALGGDLGFISINPAASAVASYSQVTLTPGLNICINKTHGVPYGNNPLDYFQRQMRNSHTEFIIPNVAFSINWDTYGSLLKNVTFGVAMNTTQTFSDNTYANGTNSKTSFMGSLAENAHLDGYNGDILRNENSWGNAPWDYVAAMQGGLIAPFDVNPDENVDKFVGSTEAIGTGNIKFLAGDIDQYFGRERHGSKNEYAFNFGMNFGHKIYVGLNLNLNSLNYNSLEYIKEDAIDPKNFETEFTNNETGEVSKQFFYTGKMTKAYSASGIGFSTKLGVIVLPVKGLRIGAAIQTPTWNRINEEWTTDARTEYSKTTFTGESPLGKNTYSFREPMRANFGVAYTFGKFALLSADYELAAYDQMKFTSHDRFSEEFDGTNQDIREFTGIGHSFRVGTEIKVTPSFAIRAGYGLMTPGEYQYDEKGKKKELNVYTHNASFGIGYSSKGSFFADLACKGTFYPTEYIMPYREYVYQKDPATGNYITDGEGNLVPDTHFSVPEIENIKKMWKVMLTFGFRF